MKATVLSYMLILDTSFVFIIGEPGYFCVKQFEMFDDELGQCDWYLLTIELQRMYMILLSETQNPKKISSYGGIACDRNTSKKVLGIKTLFDRNISK